jgi:hypothetical protein
MRIDPLTGKITWTPTPSQSGTYAIKVLVDDLQGGRSRQLFEVNVGSPGSSPSPASQR